MCQLTFLYLDKPTINKSLLTAFLFGNTVSDHRDGFGFFDGETLWKTENHPWNYYGWKIYISPSNMYLAHVRKAASKYGYNTSHKNGSHPFESKDFVLAHNGVLELKEEDKSLDKEKIDSEIFLDTLQTEYDKNKDFVKAIQSSVSKFWGKFAFLIFEKSTKKYYAIRGESATLFYCPIDVIKVLKDGEINSYAKGYVVNTEKASILTGLILSSSIFPNEFFISCPVDEKGTVLLEKEIVELDKNSIYLLENTKITKIGDVVESKKPVTTYVYNNQQNYPSRVEDVPTVFTNIGDFILGWGINFKYLDLMCCAMMGTPLLYLKVIDYELFANMLKDLELICGDRPKKKKIWVSRNLNDLKKIHEKLEFPYMLNSEDKLKEVLL